MGRPIRVADGGLIYHVLNRANGRMTIFEKDEDYEALERVLHEAVERTATRLVACCVMPNHRHLMVWPQADGELSRFTGWVKHVNAPHTDAELSTLRRSVQRGSPFGEASWSDEMARRLGQERTLRPRGRPQQHQNGS